MNNQAAGPGISGRASCCLGCKYSSWSCLWSCICCSQFQASWQLTLVYTKYGQFQTAQAQAEHHYAIGLAPCSSSCS